MPRNSSIFAGLALLAIGYFLLPLAVSAAPFSLEVSPGQGGARVTLDLSATTTSVNAIEGEIRLPPGARASHIYTGSSIVGNWLVAPRESAGAVSFAGIIPGGFTGSAVPGAGLSGDAAVFSFTIEGAADPITLAEGALYLNDGEGTRVAVADGTLPTVLTHGGMVPEDDRTPPEYVDATYAGGSAALGKPALLISSYDAESGIDRFEVSEGGDAWAPASEVYFVQDTTGLRSISVRAYDRAGNFVETKVEGRNAGYLAAGYALAALLALGIIALLVYLVKRRT